MYVNLKLEPDNSDKTVQENTLIRIDDDHETIGSLKHLLEKYIGLKADVMTIRSLGESFKNTHKLKDFFKENSEEDEVSFMLFTMSPHDDQFFCFLRLCKTYEVAKRQHKYVQTNALPKKTNASDAVVLYSGTVSDSNSDSDSDSDDSSTEFDSRSSENSDSSAINESKRLRRLQREKIAEKNEIKNKYVSEYPSTVQTLLFDEFVSSTAEPQPTATEAIINEPSPQLSSDETLKKQCSKRLFDEDIPTAQKRPCYGASKIVETIEQIDPEHRQYIVTITKMASDSSTALPMTKEHLEELCQDYFDCFRKADLSVAAGLEFLPQSPYLYNGCIHIVCRSGQTRSWMLQQQLQHKWKVQYFEDFYKLLAFHIIVPYVRKAKGLAALFELLEVQNPSIKTTLWVVLGRQRLSVGDGKGDDYERTSYLGEHEVIDLLIDAESEAAIGKYNFQLKYCFWKVNVKNAESNIKTKD